MRASVAFSLTCLLLGIGAPIATAATTQAQIEAARNNALAWLFTHQLNDGSWDGVQGGRFTVRTASGGNPAQRFYWEVKAVRADVAPLQVEKLKATP